MRLASSSSGRPSFATATAPGVKEDEDAGVEGKEGMGVEEEDEEGGRGTGG